MPDEDLIGFRRSTRSAWNPPRELARLYFGGACIVAYWSEQDELSDAETEGFSKGVGNGETYIVWRVELFYRDARS